MSTATRLGQSVLEMTPEQLRWMDFGLAGVTTHEGRVTIFEAPQPGADYSVGMDTGLATQRGDYDTLCGYRADRGKPYRQVFEVCGRYGERFHRLVYAMLRMYHDALLFAERQTLGLSHMRTLLDEYRYPRIWYEREQVSRSKPRRDVLGWYKSGSRANDVNLTAFRLALRDGSVELYSLELLDQMGRLVFARKDKKPGEVADERLDIKLEGGNSPDLVMAAMYGYAGCWEIGGFPRAQVEQPKPGSIGEQIGHAEDWKAMLAESRGGRVRSRRRRRGA